MVTTVRHELELPTVVVDVPPLSTPLLKDLDGLYWLLKTNWCTGQYVKEDTMGNKRYCLIGGVEKVTSNGERRRSDLVNALWEALPVKDKNPARAVNDPYREDDIIGFNDSPNTRHESVLHLIETARAAAPR